MMWSRFTKLPDTTSHHKFGRVTALFGQMAGIQIVIYVLPCTADGVPDGCLTENNNYPEWGSATV